jgi:hypothetical protein
VSKVGNQTLSFFQGDILVEPDWSNVGFSQGSDLSYLTYKVFINSHPESIAVSLVSVFNVPYSLLPSTGDISSLGFYTLLFTNCEIFVKLDRLGEFVQVRFLFLPESGEISQSDKEMIFGKIKNFLLYFNKFE